MLVLVNSSKRECFDVLGIDVEDFERSEDGFCWGRLGAQVSQREKVMMVMLKDIKQ